MSSDPHCTLCRNEGRPFHGPGFFLCPVCRGLFRPPQDRPTPEAEAARYRLHHNDSGDPGYRRFVYPLVQAVLTHHQPGDRGLDFGSGPDSAAAVMLEEMGFGLVRYDPVFHPDRQSLASPYDFIICCEVMEHFHHPDREFQCLRQLLCPGGRLYCMTQLFDESIDFNRWSYKNDFTHIFFYQQSTLEWIRKRYGFHSVNIDNRLIVFSL